MPNPLHAIIQRIAVAVLIAVVAVPAGARAYVVEPGAIWLGAAVAPRVRLHSAAGGAAAFMALGAQGEYAITKSWAGVTDLNIGLAGTIATRFAIGPRYRVVGRGSAISPFGQVQLVVGRFNRIGGINLGYWGVRLAGGADYFLTAHWRAGTSIGLDLGSTLGSRDGGYDSLEWAVHAAYKL